MRAKFSEDEGYFVAPITVRPDEARLHYYSTNYDEYIVKKRMQEAYTRLTENGVTVTPRKNSRGYWYLLVNTYELYNSMHTD